MKPLLLLLPVAGLVFGGCKKEEAPPAQPTPPPSASGNPLTAPVDYLGAVAKAQKTANKTLGAVGLDQAIKMFYGQEGRFPRNLGELSPDYLASIPAPPVGFQYSYNPTNGVVKVLPK